MSAKKPRYPWDVLNLPEQPETQKETKRAYAKRLKTIDQTTEIAEFEELRNAYEHALSLHQHTARAVPQPSVPTTAETAADITLVDPETTPTPDETPNLNAEDVERVAEQADHEKLDALLTEIRTKNIVETDAVRIKRILADPIFLISENKNQAEFEIAEMLDERLSYVGDAGPVLPFSVRKELLELIEHQFQWSSDYIGFSQRLPMFVDLAIAVNERLYGKQKFVAPLSKTDMIWQKILEMVASNYFWPLGLFSGVIFANLNVTSDNIILYVLSFVLLIPLLLIAVVLLAGTVFAVLRLVRFVWHFIAEIAAKFRKS